MKEFKGIAEKGRSKMEWYVEFKLHMLCNEKDEIINFVLTQLSDESARCDGCVLLFCSETRSQFRL